MAVSRKNIIDYICSSLGCSSVVLLDEFETIKTRHICHGGKDIRILSREYMGVGLPDGGFLRVEYYLCRNCGKLILNKSSLSLLDSNVQRFEGYTGAIYGNPNSAYEEGYSRAMLNNRQMAEIQNLQIMQNMAEMQNMLEMQRCMMQNDQGNTGYFSEKDYPFSPDDPFGFGDDF